MARLIGAVAALGLLCVFGCSSDDDKGGAPYASGSGGTSSAGSDGGAGGSSSNGGTGNNNNGNGNGNGSGGSSGADTSDNGANNTSSGGPPILPTVPGDPDPDAPDTVLPELPALVNVKAVATDDSVAISYEPVDGADDYRVYPLPDDEDITVDDDGHLTIQNAIYRCAGDRQFPPVRVDGEDLHAIYASSFVETDVFGFTRTLEDATLGYVWVTPGDGRVPVYALGESDGDSDNDCGRYGDTTRVKRYVTSEAERDALLADGARDDGIVFYAPAPDTDGAEDVLTTTDFTSRYYFLKGSPEADFREGESNTPEFTVLKEQEEGTVPLMRVFYDLSCGREHDELVTGMTRFERARYQGSQTPMYDVHWSGLKEETILVVEALVNGCPDRDPAILAPVAKDGYLADLGSFQIDYAPWMTLEDMQDLTDVGDVYINGQHEPDSRPIPIARSFVKIAPGPKPDLDWFTGFGDNDSLGDLEETNCGAPDGNCFQNFRMVSDEVDISWHYVDTERYGMGTMLNELWITYGDLGADTNGKFRLTPTARGEMTDDSFLYVTMDVDAISTGRRYPQFLVSDQPPPLHHTMAEGNTLIVQTFSEWPPFFELEVCDHKVWDVNNQCPRADLRHYFDQDGNLVGVPPNPELSERIGVDRQTRFEAYMSTERAYLFLDGRAYGCVDLPDSGVPSGEVSVTFGDVLYHSGVDDLQHYDYYKSKYQQVTRRHFDNLGFKSGVSAPAWDESRFPCVSSLSESPR